MRYQLFVDLDGVLADFDSAVEKITGLRPSQQSPKAMWPRLARTPDFYASLPWTEDGPELWRRVAPLDPVILTGLPRGNWAEPQKLEWCHRELGPEVPVIACMSREKADRAAEWLSEHAAGSAASSAAGDPAGAAANDPASNPAARAADNPAAGNTAGREAGATPVPVLIDDRASLKERWEEAGGVFILHTSGAESIAALEKLGL